MVAKALRAALEVPGLEGQWTLATSMCDSRVYMTKEEQNRNRERRNEDWRHEGNDASIEPTREENKTLDDRVIECMKLDARTFLRVGFKQIPEVIGTRKDTPAWFFALPSFFNGPILSHEEASAIQILEPPDLPPQPTGVNDVLFTLVKRACNKRRDELASMAIVEHDLNKLKQTMRTEWQNEANTIEKYDRIQALLENNDELRQQVEGIEMSEDEHRAMAGLRRRHESTFEDWFGGLVQENGLELTRKVFEQKCSKMMSN